MEDKPESRPVIQFDDLNVLGKAVFLGGIFTRAATQVVEAAIRATADVVDEARRAFQQGLDANIDDARILDETVEDRRRPSGDPSIGA